MDKNFTRAICKVKFPISHHPNRGRQLQSGKFNTYEHCNLKDNYKFLKIGFKKAHLEHFLKHHDLFNISTTTTITMFIVSIGKYEV